MTVSPSVHIAHQESEESRIRTDLAACYRLMHKFAMTDLIFTHVSARLPGSDGHFLLNPYGLMFNEITASSLVEVDARGNAVGDGPWGVNWAGYVIHSAVLAGRRGGDLDPRLRPAVDQPARHGIPQPHGLSRL